MSRRALVSGCLLSAILWLAIALIFTLGVAVGRATAASRSAPPSGVPLASSTVRAGAQSGASRSESRGAEGSQPGVSVTDSGVPPPTATVTPAPSANPRLTAPKLGIASWYADPSRPGGEYAAMHAYRWGMAPYPVVVCAFDGGRSACITVHVVDHCYCRVGGSTRLIDLSPAAFAQLAPLSRGLVKVSVEVLR